MFSLGASSNRCQGAGSVTYAATASYMSGISYKLDNTTKAAGNTINASTGAVTYTATWSGSSIITATASGCGSNTTANHTVTTNLPATTPVFTATPPTPRCQGSGSFTVAATASNITGMVYSIDAATKSGGVNINASSGTSSWNSGWYGPTTITATATAYAGCPSPTNTFNVTTIATVSVPVFTLGSTSSRCRGATTVTYNASATTNTGIVYSLDAASLSAGNTINAATGDVSYTISWVGSCTITATASGCNGPSTNSHIATTTGDVTVPCLQWGILRNVARLAVQVAP